MDIQAHFTDIGPVIKADLDAARQSIDVAVAWLTDPALFEVLLARGVALMPYEDPEWATLRLELRTLEAQVVALSQEQAELERLIQEFARRQHEMLGDLLEESLRLRQQYWQRQAMRRTATDEDREAHAHAREDYADYQQSREDVERMPEAPGSIPTSRRNSSACSGRPVCRVIPIG